MIQFSAAVAVMIQFSATVAIENERTIQFSAVQFLQAKVWLVRLITGSSHSCQTTT